MKENISAILAEKSEAKRSVFSVQPTSMVSEAVARMNELKVGALLVLVEGELAGIFTERDVLTRIVGAGKDPRTTAVSEVMTSKVAVIDMTTTTEEAMAIMTEKRCRHLPVLAEGKIQGLVSIGDLTAWVVRGQKQQIDELYRYMSGGY